MCVQRVRASCLRLECVLPVSSFPLLSLFLFSFFFFPVSPVFAWCSSLGGFPCLPCLCACFLSSLGVRASCLCASKECVLRVRAWCASLCPCPFYVYPFVPTSVVAAAFTFALLSPSLSSLPLLRMRNSPLGSLLVLLLACMHGLLRISHYIARKMSPLLVL